MLTKRASEILDLLIDLTGGTEKRVTYVLGKPIFCLWDDASATRDFSEYDDEIDGIMELLTDDGLIRVTENGVFRLTQSGLHYRELQRLSKREKRRERLIGYFWGVLTGITVSIIGTLLSSLLSRLSAQ